VELVLTPPAEISILGLIHCQLQFQPNLTPLTIIPKSNEKLDCDNTEFAEALLTAQGTLCLFSKKHLEQPIELVDSVYFVL
jgi:hypothetical protein